MKKDDFEDDGRTICSMDDLEMMSPFRLSRKERKADKAAIKAEIKWCRDNGADIVVCFLQRRCRG